MGVSSFLLVFFYSRTQAAGGRMLTVLTNRLGDGCFLLGFCGQMEDLNLLRFGVGSGIRGSLFLVAAFSKRAQWPMCAWLPAAMAAPTPISSLVHSSTLVTAGVFIMLRLDRGVGDVYCEFL